MYEYLIKWSNGTESTHRSNEHTTVDHVANSLFGQATAQAVQELYGNIITPMQGVGDGQGSEQVPSKGGTVEGTIGSEDD